VPLRGSVAALAVGATLFILSCLGMGLAVSAIAPSEDTANIAALMIALLPAFMLSGFVFPLEQMPTVIQWVSYAFPARYMVTLSRAVFLKGAGFAQVWPQLAALALATVILIALSTALYSRRARQ
jgi:ABC-2 type transport system permease protein